MDQTQLDRARFTHYGCVLLIALHLRVGLVLSCQKQHDWTAVASIRQERAEIARMRASVYNRGFYDALDNY